MSDLLKGRIVPITLFCMTIWSLSPAPGHCEEEYSAISLQFENDAVFETDSQYSNGIFFTYVLPVACCSLKKSPERDALSTLHRLFFPPDETSHKTASISAGQNIYTPSDTEQSELLKDDRPYAGLAYLSLGLHDQDSWTLRTVEFDFGLVGYHSYAEDTQQVVHDFFAWDQPQGWDHQLDDELFMGLTLQQHWKLTNEGGETGLGFQLIPHLTGTFGNAFINTAAGTELRIGWNLPKDFGSARIRQGALATASPEKLGTASSNALSKIGIHVFGSVEGELSIRNILFDGNMFSDSHNVDKEPFVLTRMAGISLRISSYKLTYAHVYKTREFRTQEDNFQFASLTLAYTF